MATWMVHLRIAQRFLKYFDKTHGDEFIVGNLAPDCGYGKKDGFDGFIPPSNITHWTKTGKKTDVDLDSFFDEYMKDKDLLSDGAFYLGYYIHLMTDIKWGSEIYSPMKEKYKAEYVKNPQYLLVIKRDWNDIDYEFYKSNPNFEAFLRLEKMGNIKDYLPYYETGQLSKQCRFIVDYYKNHPFVDTDREYLYLTREREDRFIDEMEKIVKDKFF